MYEYSEGLKNLLKACYGKSEGKEEILLLKDFFSLKNFNPNCKIREFFEQGRDFAK